MKANTKETRQENVDNEARFYLVFDDVTKDGPSNNPEVSFDEIDEIDQISRMILESTEEIPVFMTCT
jgi:hypothetical protein